MKYESLTSVIRNVSIEVQLWWLLEKVSQTVVLSESANSSH